ncbi:aconitate hydratase AcnA [Pseudomonas fluorescens group sp.]|uniref:Aconitate hydratase n=4 Tax=Pseudomonas fluorescens group TaxID=136843 RepID=C3K5G3_PSEFS|nr:MULTISPECIES: aconitate hydratase AcnA [Pseudomonas fluorescens group]MBZ6458981.1 aconitate hydratase AcnA [Pseudomonas fluorescens group sp.]MBZ6461138.1 aconitate hydratase AcnA [Pseudomonas fluorescens group sp.]MBZ6471250.1 aconitate hydratase AcnA [Pseudomonas fluorescens group sp.]WQD73838.1 aconitate hydratase AcnA [Pseudomonas marginalis]CAI2795828.1 Aconitate hydratase (Aconitase) (EC [Pseudomonas fluorescens SBW25]
MSSLDSLRTLKTLQIDDKTYHYFSLPEAAKSLGDLDKLPMSLKVLLENLLRWEDDKTVTGADLKAIAAWLKERQSDREIQYRPARVLMQDFTGVPAVVDLAAMRAAVAKAGGDPQRINPLSPVDLVIDHSVMVDKFGNADAFEQNVDIEMQRNGERYAFLRWGQSAFDNFSVVPPGTGICHQVNLEYLGRTVWTKDEDGRTYAFPDTLVGTDSHTTMINGLGVLGWGVGGIEAEAAMLGQPVSMLIPEVIGFKLTGKLKEGITATDLVLTVTQMLRKKGVVGKFVEFYGDGLADLPLADRATIANMAPEYGATCGFFPVDEVTLDYLRLSGRPAETVKLVEAYTKAQGLWRTAGQEPVFTDSLALDMGSVEASLAGPKRPQDRVSLPNVGQAFSDFLDLQFKPANKEEGRLESEGGGGVAVGNADLVGETDYEYDGQTYRLKNGAVVIAAITSCTNTSNPSVMMAAGLVAKKAVEKGLTRKPWVKTSLAPGSKVVTDYYKAAGLTQYLDKLGFDLVGYGCTTCIGNSGPLPEPIEKAIQKADLAVASVLSGNRNFEGRVHPLVKTNWLASPPLVVAYALAGTVRIDISSEPLGNDQDGNPVYLKDIWPSSKEIADAVAQVSTGMFHKEYAEVFAGDEQWQAIEVPQAATYVWQKDSTYIQHPPFFDDIAGPLPVIKDVRGANVLALLGDSVTTDHISPAGNIKTDSPAGRYLREQGVEPRDFNSYGSRRGNHEVMMRGTFANIRIRNEMLGGEEGGNTLYIPTGEKMPIYDAAMKYQASGTPLVVIAGQEYGTGSSRDWAAKGTNLLGVKAVIAESFERIHRSNLVGMGVLPLQFKLDQNRTSLKLTGKERIDILGLTDVEITPRMNLTLVITREDGSSEKVEVLCRIDTLNEVEYFKAGGILHYVLRQLIAS